MYKYPASRAPNGKSLKYWMKILQTRERYESVFYVSASSFKPHLGMSRAAIYRFSSSVVLECCANSQKYTTQIFNSIADFF